VSTISPTIPDPPPLCSPVFNVNDKDVPTKKKKLTLLEEVRRRRY
jgi:hypothetical protein